MKILIASGIFHPDSGGPATYLYRLLPDLIARGHMIRALAYGNALQTGYPYPLTRIPFGSLPVRLYRYNVAYRQGVAWSDLIYLNSLGLPREFAPRRPRVMKVVGDYAWERSVNSGWLPGTESIDVFQSKRYDLRIEFFKRARAIEVQRVDHVIVPSEYLRRMVIGWGARPENVTTIYNALDHTHEKSMMSKQEARSRLGWRADGRYLFTAARLTAWKGIDYLIDALHHVPEVNLVIAGDGSTRADLERRAAPIADRVHFLGKILNTEIATYMRAADYFVLYSGYEGLAHTLLEALYAGVPAIASDRGGNPEIIRHGHNGLLVPHPDTDALIAALQTAFTDDLPTKLAANTADGLDKFDWSRLVEQTESILTRFAR